jgi:hypothetical protein
LTTHIFRQLFYVVDQTLCCYHPSASFNHYATQETSYPYHSIEGQMRALADLALLLGQYEFAVQTYRLAAQDYLAAPNSRWYAGAEVRPTAMVA